MQLLLEVTNFHAGDIMVFQECLMFYDYNEIYFLINRVLVLNHL